MVLNRAKLIRCCIDVDRIASLLVTDFLVRYRVIFMGIAYIALVVKLRVGRKSISLNARLFVNWIHFRANHVIKLFLMLFYLNVLRFRVQSIRNIINLKQLWIICNVARVSDWCYISPILLELPVIFNLVFLKNNGGIVDHILHFKSRLWIRVFLQ